MHILALSSIFLDSIGFKIKFKLILCLNVLSLRYQFNLFLNLILININIKTLIPKKILAEHRNSKNSKRIIDIVSENFIKIKKFNFLLILLTFLFPKVGFLLLL